MPLKPITATVTTLSELISIEREIILEHLSSGGCFYDLAFILSDIKDKKLCYAMDIPIIVSDIKDCVNEL